MDIYQKQILRNVILLAIFIIGVYLQFVGQRTVGIKGLAYQFISVAMLLVDLYLYNKPYR